MATLLPAVKERLVPAAFEVTALTLGGVPVPMNDTEAPLRKVPVMLTVEAAPPAVPALPAIVAICGPWSTPRPKARVAAPLVSVSVTG